MIYPIPEDSGVVREEVSYLSNETLERFESLPEGAHAQLIDGEIIMSPSPTRYHQQVIVRLLTQMVRFLDEHESGEVLVAPLDVQFNDESILQPDILFFPRGHSEDDQEHQYNIPTLVVEVLSPSTAYFDLVPKFRTYEESGVVEYWIVDPMKRFIRVLINEGEGFVQHTKDQNVGMVRSTILDGFEVDVQTIFPWEKPHN